MELNTGDLIFFEDDDMCCRKSSHSCFILLFKWFMCSRVTHSAMIYMDDNTPYVMECTLHRSTQKDVDAAPGWAQMNVGHNGVQIRKLDCYDTRNMKVRRYIGVDKQKKIKKMYKKVKERDYDSNKCDWLSVVCSCRYKRRKFVCSTFMGYLLGLKDAAHMTPQSLMTIDLANYARLLCDYDVPKQLDKLHEYHNDYSFRF